jgi:hypothetical protein
MATPMSLSDAMPTDSVDSFLSTAEYSEDQGLAEDATKAPRAPRGGGGLAGRFRTMLGSILPGATSDASTGPVSDALAAYRRRAREILEALKADGDKEHALGVVAVKLQALLEDMKSIGTEATLLKPLEALLLKLQPKARRATPAQLVKIMEQLAAEAESVLDAFAGAAANPV